MVWKMTDFLLRNKSIISGRFDFVGTDKTTGRQVHVTDGRFDVRF